jgi:hypothetical protein
MAHTLLMQIKDRKYKILKGKFLIINTPKLLKKMLERLIQLISITYNEKVITQPARR